MAVMEHVRISTTTELASTAGALAANLLDRCGLQLPRSASTIALSGQSSRMIAAVATLILARGHRLVLTPWRPTASSIEPPLGANLWIYVTEDSANAIAASPRPGPASNWQIAMYSSGSTGAARAYGFTSAQLDQVAAWYARIYGVTAASCIVTSLPATYNFTFTAGLWLAARTGASLHLSRSSEVVFQDVTRIAPETDRSIVLANPVLLQCADHTIELPANTMIDSGGAPLGTPAIAYLRQVLGDVREGYGLTETASLTHFDGEGSPASLGTVGQAMPGVGCTIMDVDGKPRLKLHSPAIGIELDENGSGTARTSMLTSDLAALDTDGRLRLLGRADDFPIAGHWPRDTLDMIGPLTGVRCAMVRHPTPGTVQIRVLGPVSASLQHKIGMLLAEEFALPTDRITVASAAGHLLHSHKLPRGSNGETP